MITASGYEPVAGFSEQCNELSGYVKMLFIDQLLAFQEGWNVKCHCSVYPVIFV